MLVRRERRVHPFGTGRAEHEHGRHHRRGERRAGLADHGVEGRGVGDIPVGDGGERGDGGGHEERPHGEAEQEHVAAQRPQPGAGVRRGEEHQHARHTEEPGADDHARADPGVDHAHQLHRQQDAEGLGEGGAAAVQRAAAEGVLHEERAEEHRAHDRDVAEQADQVGVPEQPVAEEREPHGGLADAEFRPYGQHQQHRSDGERAEHRRRAPALAGAGAEAVHQRGGGGGAEQQAAQVEPAGRLVAVLGQEQQSEGHGEDADRRVHVEDPPPGQAGDEHSAEQRGDGRGDLLGDDQQAGQPDLLGVGEGAVQQGLRGGREQTCREPLQGPRADERRQVRCRAAEHGGAGEHGEGEQEHPAAAEAFQQPGGEGDHHAQADRVHDHDGVERRGRELELAGDTG